MLNFYNQSIITMFQKMSSGIEKMKKLLEDVALPLENGITNQFYKLLEILEKSGVEDTKSLADLMRREIRKCLIGTVCSYRNYAVYDFIVMWLCSCKLC